MKPIITLLILFFTTLSFSQQINGVILYQNSGGQPAEGVEITAFGCSTVYSQSNGMFILPCTKKPGQKIKLRIGREDAGGTDIEWVNSDQLKVFNMPASPDHDPIDIIVCVAGTRNEAASSFYGILIKDNTNKFDKKLKELEKLIQEGNNNTETTASLVEQQQQLMQEKLEAEEKIEELAQELANINLDQASEIVKEAIRKLTEEQDVEGALEILDETRLDESIIIASNEIEKANKAIKEAIEGYELRISLLAPKFDYENIANLYDKIILTYETYNFNKEELGYILLDAALNKYESGKYQEAIDLQTKTLNIVNNLEEKDLSLLGSIYTGIGLSKYEMGEFQLALENHQKSIDILKSTEDSTSMVMAEAYSNIGLVNKELEKYEDALQYFNMALDLEQRQDSLNLKAIALSNHNISYALTGLGNHEEAIEYELKAIDQAEEVLKSNDPQLATHYSLLSYNYSKIRNYEKALEYQLKTVEIREKVLPPMHPDLALAYNNIGDVYRRIDKQEESLEYHKKAVEIGEVVLSSTHPKLAIYYQNTGLCYRRTKQYDQAIMYQQKALSIKENTPSITDRSLAISYASLGTTLYLSTDFTKALEYLKKASDIRREIYEPGHRALTRTLLDYSLSLSATGNTDEAKAILEELESTLPEDERIHRNRVIMHACSGDEKAALKSLKKAIELGYKDLEWLMTNPCIDTLVENEKYKEITAPLMVSEK
ncbi:MAG: tetratricopeptide repeat protein [Saprospiraceae bacterium]|nr:tetratricopeptide repeat protein [Saprospiraceae bacterium]